MKQQIEQLIKRLSPDGQPIFIWDILPFIAGESSVSKNSSIIGIMRQGFKVIAIWKDHGIVKSMQGLYGECEWEEVCGCPEGSDPFDRDNCSLIEVPKQPEIRNLFELLISLNLAE